MGSQQNLRVQDLKPKELRASGEEFSREPRIVKSLALSLGSGFTF